MAKPAGSRCNLACKYCYYLEKSNLYADNPQEVMSDELLEVFIRDYIAAQTMPQVLFTWHGGETLMRPLSFYKKVIELERKYANGRTIDNCIQTNGTLLTDEWCRFFKENNWLVGLSIDGPQEFHDEYRRNRADRPSFRQVMHGINLLNRHGVEWNALAVVNDFNADYPLDFYHFFKEIGCHYIQFTPIVERLQPHTDGRTLAAVDEEGTGGLTEFSVTPEQWGNFLVTIFDEWVRNDVGDYFIQLFDSTLANWVGQPRTLFHGPDLWSCGCGGMERRRVLVRPLCVSSVQTGQHYAPKHFELDAEPTTAYLRAEQARQTAGTVPRVRLFVCLQWRMPEKPLCTHSRWRTGVELPLRGLSPLFCPCGPLHGLDEARIAQQAATGRHCRYAARKSEVRPIGC